MPMALAELHKPPNAVSDTIPKLIIFGMQTLTIHMLC